ncbi:hypothetical protein ACHAXT_008362 [Thalassiosira profunda]
MSDDENGIKGNAGDFGFPENGSKAKARRKPRRSTPKHDGGAKIMIALLAGAGAAFLLALVLLMSRLEAEEGSNGLLNSNVGGARGVDDQILAEEVAEGHASPALLQQDRQRKRANKLVQHIHKVKGVYDKKLAKFKRAFDLPDGNPLERVIHEGEAEMDGIANALQGKGKKLKHKDLQKDFKDAIHEDNEKFDRRKKKRARRDREKEESQEEFADEKSPGEKAEKANSHGVGLEKVAESDAKESGEKPGHLYPLFPPMPPHKMAVDLFGEEIITNTISHDKPTMAGIIGILQTFLQKLHQLLKDNKNSSAQEVIDAYFALVNKHLEPFEHAYRDREIFPVREDESIFMSLGAYRDHLLGETLKQSFKNALHPDKLFVGAVVQNCFGGDDIVATCRTGVEVKGKNERGNPLTQVSDRPPDVNGIEQFCGDPDYVKYCDSGQIRVLYVNETESNGPTTARYFASKLWGGETYFMQSDAHLRFAPEWDRRYIEEVKATKSYPKAVLSSYPPGFSEADPPYKGGSKGTRLCTCTFSDSDVEHKIIRINTGNSCQKEQPTQIAYIAAGFFFARAEFLIDVPFDPFLPWCFMGEEIALSLRAWTHGWDIYAPRKNWITHQYRPGRMGLPKFWENTGRVFGRPGPGFNTQLQTISIQRIKHMVGYKESGTEALEADGTEVVLTDFEHYSYGETRTMKEFLDHVKIDVEREKCGHIDWCNECTLD